MTQKTKIIAGIVLVFVVALGWFWLSHGHTEAEDPLLPLQESVPRSGSSCARGAT